MQTIEILNGDALKAQLQGAEAWSHNSMAVFRECLIEGPLSATIDSDFWQQRSLYIQKTYELEPQVYQTKTLDELIKFIPKNGSYKLYLWFERDLYCQVNLWALISYFAQQEQAKLYLVSPPNSEAFGSFSPFYSLSDAELKRMHHAASMLSLEDIGLAKALWTAYAEQDFNLLEKLSQQNSENFKALPEICAKLKDLKQDPLNSIPAKFIRSISHPSKNSTDCFAAFSQNHPEYGLTDLYFERLYKEIHKF